MSRTTPQPPKITIVLYYTILTIIVDKMRARETISELEDGLWWQQILSCGGGLNSLLKLHFFISGFNVQDLVREDILYKNVKGHLAGTRLGMKSKFEAQTFEFDIFLWLKDLLLF